jgi:enhancing lycopene biosynthesis protein 2
MTKNRKIAVILSGCGVYDGAEIHESVFTLWAIEKAGAKASIFAPDVDQHHVVNHITGQPTGETRNVLTEAARIARGKIFPLSELKVTDFDALVFPGGFGVAKNLCSFAFEGPNCTVLPEIEQLIRTFHQQNKPIGALCISPALITKVLGKVEVTIGNDSGTAKAIEVMGGTHKTSTHGEVVIDKANKLVTTPCYMLDATIAQIASGADNLIEALIHLI